VLVGCDSIDPSVQAFAIGFRNDLGHAAVLRPCKDDACHDLADSLRLRPGERAEDNVSDREVLTRWLVQDRRGRTLGCLLLTFDAKYDAVTVRLSQAQPCPGRQPLTARRVQHGRRLGGET
jgi:hypothetical protein